MLYGTTIHHLYYLPFHLFYIIEKKKMTIEVKTHVSVLVIVMYKYIT